MPWSTEQRSGCVCVWGGGGKGLGVKSNFSDSKWTIQHPSVVCSPVIITILLSSLLVCTPYQVPHWGWHNHSGSLHNSPLRDLFTGVRMRLSLNMIQPFLALGEINPRGLGPRNSKATGSFWVLVLPIWKTKFLDHRGWLLENIIGNMGGSWDGIPPRVTALELIKLCWMEEGVGRWAARPVCIPGVKVPRSACYTPSMASIKGNSFPGWGETRNSFWHPWPLARALPKHFGLNTSGTSGLLTRRGSRTVLAFS